MQFDSEAQLFRLSDVDSLAIQHPCTEWPAEEAEDLAKEIIFAQHRAKADQLGIGITLEDLEKTSRYFDPSLIASRRIVLDGMLAVVTEHCSEKEVTIWRQRYRG